MIQVKFDRTVHTTPNTCDFAGMVPVLVVVIVVKLVVGPSLLSLLAILFFFDFDDSSQNRSAWKPESFSYTPAVNTVCLFQKDVKAEAVLAVLAAVATIH